MDAVRHIGAMHYGPRGGIGMPSLSKLKCCQFNYNIPVPAPIPARFSPAATALRGTHRADGAQYRG